MSLADSIRTFAYQRYIRPARATGRNEVTIRAGDVHRDMGLQSRMPAVCGALRSKLFENQFDLELVSQTGPAQGSNVFFQFRLGDHDEPLDATSVVGEQEPDTKLKSERILEARPHPRYESSNSSNTVYLISCVSKKRKSRASAKDLYLSDWFIKARSYVEASGCRWFILSAEYGLVDPDDELEPYEKALNDMPISERRRWATRVLDQMSENNPDVKFVVILAGQRYREFLEGTLKSRGITVDVPMRGLRIGEQLAWLGAQLDGQ